MNSGDYNRRITICKMTDGFNDGSGRDEDETELIPLRTVWAAVKGTGGDEYFTAAAEGKENTVEFSMRYQPDLTISQEHTIQYNNQVYNVKHVNDVEERHERLILICEKR